MRGIAAPRRPILVLAGLFLVLGSMYSLVTPIFEAPDEVFHFAFVRFVATHATLPIQGAQEGEEAAHQEASQPPLYYVLAAPLIGWIDSDDFGSVGRLNPHAAPGLPHSDGNKNMVVPSPDPFPWLGTALAVHLLRFFSLLLGLVTVVCTYAVARGVWSALTPAAVPLSSPRTTDALALLTTALVAFNPQFLFISASVNNDNVMTAIATLTLAILVDMVTTAAEHPLTYRRAALLGVLSGLAMLSKLTGLLLLAFTVLTLIAITFLRYRDRDVVLPAVRHVVQCLIVVAALAAAVGGWWYLRNWTLYGDILGLRPMLAWVGQRSLSLPQLLEEMEGLELSFWGVFGWFNILADEGVYTALKIVLRLALLGLFVSGVRGRWAQSTRSINGRALLVCVAWTAVVAAGLVRWTASTPGTQGRLLFPAVAAIASLLAYGLAGLFPSRLRVSILAVAAAGLGAFALIAPFRYISPAYALPPVMSIDSPQPTHSVGLTYGNDEIRLLGYSLDRERINPSSSITITLFMEALRPMNRDYSLFVHLWGRNKEELAKRDSYPGRGSLPTSRMKAGEIVADTYVLTISPEATIPARVQLEAGFYDFDTGQRLPAVTADGAPAPNTYIGGLKLVAATAPARSAQPPLFRFGDVAALLAADVVIPPVLQTGSVITVSTTWQATSAMNKDYTIFVQLVDQTPRIVAQNDGPPQGGEYPTGIWDVGETVTDVRTLTLPVTMAPGHYRIAAGLYLLSSDERLPVSGPAGIIAEKWAVIGEIDVR